ncbi:uncharacterized protein LOC132314000, partial [Cornus florida]|uniref:uncharacterized protein LOC132314000 n=1 Tax=Cornus florida TaxID=4283 RepID=UPI0028A162AE
PNMKEVVMKEVVKLLDAGIIYPISDSKWETPFIFDEACLNAFHQLRTLLSFAPIMQPPNWSLPFEIMCDASDFAMGAVLGQRVGKLPYAIYYAKFDFEIKDKKGSDNVVADHLSRLMVESSPNLEIHESFPDEQLFQISNGTLPWFADIVNYLVTGKLPITWSKQEKDRFFATIRKYYWEDPILFRYCPDQIIRRCVPESEVPSVLAFCHTLAFAVDYVSKWVKACATKMNDHSVVIAFVKSNIFARFGMPRAMISDGGKHFCNQFLKQLFLKYSVTHKVATPYHPQTSRSRLFRPLFFRRQIWVTAISYAGETQQWIRSWVHLSGDLFRHPMTRLFVAFRRRIWVRLSDAVCHFLGSLAGNSGWWVRGSLFSSEVAAASASYSSDLGFIGVPFLPAIAAGLRLHRRRLSSDCCWFVQRHSGWVLLRSLLGRCSPANFGCVSPAAFD